MRLTWGHHDVHLLAGSVLKVSGSFRAPQATDTIAHTSAMPDSFKAVLPSANLAAMPLPPPPRPLSKPAKPREQRWDRERVKDEHTGSVAAPATGEDSDEDGDFPGAKMIQLAKQKRERLRHAQMAPDYVPSESGVFKAAADFKKAEEAVRRGSDDDGSDEDVEDGMRMKFSGAASRAHYLCYVKCVRLGSREQSASCHTVTVFYTSSMIT